MIRTVQDFLINIQPRDDEYGSYDPKYVPVIEQIQSKMNWKVDHDRSRNGNRHPFIQYGILKNTSYNNEELERIQKVISDPKYRVNLFHRFQLDPQKGDRVLYLAEVTNKKLEFVPDTQQNI
ncbi:unnamed protein product [Rotaria sordida]|uniref:Uncharacterized protein n=1 Tax=Rotaria sordida TaxID=392033 RepID=A0A813UY89_9BILA|nr:unnamed protein product [Rotaria sordida]CAF1480241.1 unnamed protein product [Rotaria sordida]CAF3945956.1 unnamed protein product [Rotaria sordida]CAF4097594.1 unnamed protein product [Rotaria sordida]